MSIHCQVSLLFLHRMQFWPFLHCIDQYKEKQDLKKAESCASETKLDWDQINTCQSGDMGHK